MALLLAPGACAGRRNCDPGSWVEWGTTQTISEGDISLLAPAAAAASNALHISMLAGNSAACVHRRSTNTLQWGVRNCASVQA